MTFSTSRLTTAMAALRHFDGEELDGMDDESFALFQETVACVYRHAGVAAAEAAAEAHRRAGGRGRPGGRRKVADGLGVDEKDAERLITAGNVLGGGDAHGEHEDASGGSGGAAGDSPGDDSSGEGSSGNRRERYPIVAAALREGRIGAAAAEMVTKTLDVLPEAAAELEGPLVAKAERLPLRELRRVCDRVRATYDRRSQAEKERRHRAERQLFVGRDHDGMTTLRAKLDAASAAPVIAWLDAQVKDAFQRRRDDRLVADADTRTAPQVRVDALVALARHGLSCDLPGSGISTEVVVRLDKDDLAGGLADDGALGTCDSLPDPLTAATLRLMAVDAGILPAVMGGESLPMDWGRTRRLFTKAQRRALVERDGACIMCLAPPSWCIVHHTTYWRDGGRTDLRDGALMCTGCHVALHTDGWGIEFREGRPWLIPPASVDPARTPVLGGTARLDPEEPAA